MRSVYPGAWRGAGWRHEKTLPLPIPDHLQFSHPHGAVGFAPRSEVLTMAMEQVRWRHHTAVRTPWTIMPTRRWRANTCKVETWSGCFHTGSTGSTIPSTTTPHRRALPREGSELPVRSSARHPHGPQRTSQACTHLRRAHCARTTLPARGAARGTPPRLSPVLGGTEGLPGLGRLRRGGRRPTGPTMTRPSPRSPPRAGQARTALRTPAAAALDGPAVGPALQGQ